MGSRKRQKPTQRAISENRRRGPLGREAWLRAARQALVEDGTAGVEINKLAKRLGVSRGGFYWFFESREQLLQDLIAYWVERGTALFERILLSHGQDGKAAYRALITMWVDETEYDPRWDGAVRDWARTSAAVRKAVSTVDQKRIALLEQMFQNMGYKGAEAHIRARITYYHQVGYYALGVHESRQERRALLPYYEKVLTGRED